MPCHTRVNNLAVDSFVHICRICVQFGSRGCAKADVHHGRNDTDSLLRIFRCYCSVAATVKLTHVDSIDLACPGQGVVLSTAARGAVPIVRLMILSWASPRSFRS